MPITITPYKILGAVCALLLIAVISAFSGWHIRGWHDDAAQLKQANKDIVAIKAGFSGVVTASNQLAATIQTRNQDTETSVAGLTVAIGNQDHALAQLRQDIKSIPVGTCSFTPDADGMYQRAYQAAFGDPGHPAAEAGKAGVSHAADRATPSPHRRE